MIHYAKLATSPRLQRTLALLKDGKKHSTRDIVRKANVMAVNTCIDELRCNGFDIPCTQEGRIFYYQLKEGK